MGNIEMVYYPAEAALAKRPDSAALLGPIGHGREASAVQLADDAMGLETGVWGIEGAVEGLVESNRHIFMMIQDGTATLTGPDGQSRDFGPLEAFVIPMGAKVRWQQPATVRAAYYTFLDEAPVEPGASFIRIDPEAPRKPSGAPPAANFFLSSPPPSQKGNEHFSDSTGTWKAGVWESSAYRRRVQPFPRHEFMHLLDGKVKIHAEDGRVYDFGPGQTFLVPYKLLSDWQATEAVRKYYCFVTGR